MKDLPIIKVTDIDLTVVTNKVLITEIDNFRFVYEEGTDYITIRLESDCDHEWIDEIDTNVSILEIGDLERVALNWIFRHVEIVKEEEL